MNSKANFLKWSSLFLLSFISISALHAQSSGKQDKAIDTAKIKCIYQLQYQPDSMDHKNIRSESMLLLIGRSSSLYQSLNFYLRDSILNNLKTKDWETIKNIHKIYSSSFLYQIYKNYPEGKISFVEEIFDDPFLIEQPMNLFNWKITSDTATISGYHCQKATTHFAGRDYIAWFTLEVPISEGPYKFNGLPGLIVKIGDTRQQYVFTLTSLQQIAIPVPIYFSKRDYIKTTWKKFTKAKRNFNNNVVERLASKGIKITNIVVDGKSVKKFPQPKNALEIIHE